MNPWTDWVNFCKKAQNLGEESTVRTPGEESMPEESKWSGRLPRSGHAERTGKSRDPRPFGAWCFARKHLDWLIFAGCKGSRPGSAAFDSRFGPKTWSSRRVFGRS